MGIPRLVKLRIIYQKFYFRRFISALFPVSKSQIMMNLKTCILLVAAILIISLGTEAESKPNCVCVHSPCECDYGEVLRERSEKAKSQVRQAGRETCICIISGGRFVFPCALLKGRTEAPCAKPAGGGLFRERFEAAKSAMKKFAEESSPDEAKDKEREH